MWPKECLKRTAARNKSNFHWTFWLLSLKKQGTVRESWSEGFGDFFYEGFMMNRKTKTTYGLLAGLMLVFALSWPLAAAEQTFDLTIPGCTS
jgi:hypothetical protein